MEIELKMVDTGKGKHMLNKCPNCKAASKFTEVPENQLKCRRCGHVFKPMSKSQFDKEALRIKKEKMRARKERREQGDTDGGGT